jgi:hypothetical protein
MSTWMCKPKAPATGAGQPVHFPAIHRRAAELRSQGRPAQPGLDAVSGVSPPPARGRAPTLRLALEDLGSTAPSAAGGSASTGGAVSSGGRIGLSGTVDVAGPGIPGAVDIRLNGRAPRRSRALRGPRWRKGALSVTGPLSVAPRVAGASISGNRKCACRKPALARRRPSRRSAMWAKLRPNAETRAAAGLLARNGSGGSGPWVSTCRSTHRAASSCAGGASTRNSAVRSASRAVPPP